MNSNSPQREETWTMYPEQYGNLLLFRLAKKQYNNSKVIKEATPWAALSRSRGKGSSTVVISNALCGPYWVLAKHKRRFLLWNQKSHDESTTWGLEDVWERYLELYRKKVFLLSSGYELRIVVKRVNKQGTDLKRSKRQSSSLKAILLSFLTELTELNYFNGTGSIFFI